MKKLIEKETIKEVGKYLLDVSKILIALTLVTPLIKDGDISGEAIFTTVTLFLIGVTLTNKGLKNE